MSRSLLSKDTLVSGVVTVKGRSPEMLWGESLEHDTSMRNVRQIIGNMNAFLFMTVKIRIIVINVMMKEKEIQDVFLKKDVNIRNLLQLVN